MNDAEGTEEEFTLDNGSGLGGCLSALMLLVMMAVVAILSLVTIVPLMIAVHEVEALAFARSAIQNYGHWLGIALLMFWAWPVGAAMDWLDPRLARKLGLKRIPIAYYGAD